LGAAIYSAEPNIGKRILASLRESMPHLKRVTVSIARNQPRFSH
jgi:hypothetical protein